MLCASWSVFVLSVPRPLISNRTDTLFPYRRLCRSGDVGGGGVRGKRRSGGRQRGAGSRTGRRRRGRRMTTAFKRWTAQQWADFERERVFRGAPVDVADGYIHLSTADQQIGRAHV